MIISHQQAAIQMMYNALCEKAMEIVHLASHDDGGSSYQDGLQINSMLYQKHRTYKALHLLEVHQYEKKSYSNKEK